MFEKILVAVDCSKSGKRVFTAALAQAKANNARLMVLHVLSPDEEGCPDTTGLLNTYYYPGTNSETAEHCHRIWEQFVQQGLAMVQAYAAEATAAGIRAESTQKPGSLGQTICEVACDWDADLIVIGRRGHSGLSELLLGSVSDFVIHRAHCSVLTVQSQAKISQQPAPHQEAARLL